MNVYGDWLPHHIAGGGSIVFAIIRQIYAVVAMRLSFFKINVIVVDQLSASIPIIKLLFPNTLVVFYCHFPDKLLASRTGSLVRTLYRIPFDYWEEKSTSLADRIVVNSYFTSKIFHQEFSSINDDPFVLYPPVSDDLFNLKRVRHSSDIVTFLSINRFEIKKNIPLAVNAFALYTSRKVNRSARLLICGGFDDRVKENAICLSELQKQCDTLNLRYSTHKKPASIDFLNNDNGHVYFVLSISEELKRDVILNSALVLYTPVNEHFGIVPVESMALGTPVLATNTGGPCETICHEQTGWLVSPSANDWANVLEKVSQMNWDEYRQISEFCRYRAKSLFSRTHMGELFTDFIIGNWKSKSSRAIMWDVILTLSLLVLMIVLVITQIIL